MVHTAASAEALTTLRALAVDKRVCIVSSRIQVHSSIGAAATERHLAPSESCPSPFGLESTFGFCGSQAQAATQVRSDSE
jgi:hypothetical protein